MVSGHLEVKKGMYYIVLSFKGKDGKRQRKTISTGLPEKGNKRKADQLLMRERKTFDAPEYEELGPQMLFSSYLLDWLEIVRVRVKPATYASYQGIIRNTLVPYFKRKNITLEGVEPRHIQSLYTEKLRKVKPNTVIHYHAILHQALKYAVKTEIIASNPVAKVDRPKKNDFTPNFCDAKDLARVFEAVKGHRLELPVLVAAFYGLRRGEVLGLRWEAIDFQQETITINHTVTSFNVDGRQILLKQNSAKTKSSMRTLPLVAQFKDYFLKAKAAQEENKRICGKSYNREHEAYIFVDELGNLIRPDYVTTEFPKLLKRNGLKHMRFHDLRHSCASLLLANGVPMKQIQEWLGHSDFSTTANVYAHLDYASKVSSAKAMESGMILPDGSSFASRWQEVS